MTGGNGRGAMLVVKAMSWPNLADLLTDDADAPVGLVGAPLGRGIGDAGRLRPGAGAAAHDSEAHRPL